MNNLDRGFGTFEGIAASAYREAKELNMNRQSYLEFDVQKYLNKLKHNDVAQKYNSLVDLNYELQIKLEETIKTSNEIIAKHNKILDEYNSLANTHNELLKRFKNLHDNIGIYEDSYRVAGQEVSELYVTVEKLNKHNERLTLELKQYQKKVLEAETLKTRLLTTENELNNVKKSIAAGPTKKNDNPYVDVTANEIFRAEVFTQAQLTFKVLSHQRSFLMSILNDDQKANLKQMFEIYNINREKIDKQQGTCTYDTALNLSKTNKPVFGQIKLDLD